MKPPVKIANVSGFYGDRASAMREQLEGGDVDVLTGDYLAELTMLILARTKQRQPDGGYARSFVAQLGEVLDMVLDRGVKVIVNAGGLDPEGCAAAVQAVAVERGRKPVVAAITGDNLVERLDELRADEAFVNAQTGESANQPFEVANAYLGGWGITEALNQGADIVITGRVTDAALVSGTAAWWHGWGRYEYDQLAGAVVAGHVVECGMQATGGNYSFFDEIDDLRYPGFPWAEIAGDGSSVIGKHPGTGGAVTRETVVSQLLYEIGSPAYLGPDVTARFDTVQVDQIGVDRVRISGTRGEAPPATLKVAAATTGGYRNTMTVGITGLNQQLKASLVSQQIWAMVPFEASDFDDIAETIIGAEQLNPGTNGSAVSFWQLSVSSSDETKVGRVFANAATQTVLGSIPGMFALAPPSGAQQFARYWPTSIGRHQVEQSVSLDGRTYSVGETDPVPGAVIEVSLAATGWSDDGETVPLPLGSLIGARSGDKGGSANIGLYARTAVGFGWLADFLSIHQLRLLMPELHQLEVDRFELPNLWAINFVIHGLMGDGVSSSLRLDPQAKGLGEYLRAKVVDIPVSLLTS